MYSGFVWRRANTTYTPRREYVIGYRSQRPSTVSRVTLPGGPLAGFTADTSPQADKTYTGVSHALQSDNCRAAGATKASRARATLQRDARRSRLRRRAMHENVLMIGLGEGRHSGVVSWFILILGCCALSASPTEGGLGTKRARGSII